MCFDFYCNLKKAWRIILIYLVLVSCNLNFLMMIPAFKKNEELIEEMDSLLSDKDNFHIWWLGQSGFLLQWKRKRVLIDPYLSDSLTKKYAATDKPHMRMSERVMDPELLKNISI